MVNVFMRGGVDRLCRRMKIMKPDGTVIKLSGPAFVKEILLDYPNHRIFEAAAFGGLGIGSLPLPEMAGLVAGHLYYLIPHEIPFPHHEFFNYNTNTNTEHFAEPSSPPFAGTTTDSRKQQEAEDDVFSKINRGGVRIVSSSNSIDGSTVRVKLRLRKEDLASFLSANNFNVVTGNVSVPPSVQDGTRQALWKPRLDTIPETHNPFGELETSLRKTCAL